MFHRIEHPRIMREILSQIKQRIADGQLRKGNRLPSERQMADQFGVSRSVIREALKSLEMIGLIECVQGGGHYIAANMDNSLTEPLSVMFMLEEGTLQQVQQLRRILETGAVGLAADRITATELSRIGEICEQLETDNRASDEAAMDRAFHSHIALASGNPLFITMQQAVSALIESQIRDVRSTILREQHTLVQVNQQHRAIYAALQAGDRNRAVTAMNDHLDFIEPYLGY